MAFNHHNPAVGNVVKLPVALQVVADDSIRWHTDVLVENRAPNAGAPADVAVIENNGILDICVRVNAHAAPDHGSTHQPAGENGPSGHDGIDGMAAPPVGIENEFGRRIEISGCP